jgi:hypothetical protein
MELDHLKDMWQKQEAPPTPGLQEIISKRSNSPIAKMKRNLIMELIMVVIFLGAVILYYFAAFSGKFQVVSWVYLSLIALFGVYFYFKYKLLNEMECMACQVKSNLSKQVSTLEKFVRLYLIVGTAIIPAVIIFFYFFEMSNFPAGNNFFILPSEKNSIATSLAVLAFICVASTVPIYYLNKWYIRKLYGKQIERLKLMLEQMD